MRQSLERYKQMEGVGESHFIDLEARPYMVRVCESSGVGRVGGLGQMLGSPVCWVHAGNVDMRQ